jgi:hypothetical protein
MNYYYLAYIHEKLRDNRIYVKDFNKRFLKTGGGSLLRKVQRNHVELFHVCLILHIS